MPRTGERMSDETRAKVSATMRGRKLTAVHKRRISAGMIRYRAVQRYRAEQARERSGT